MMRAAKRIAIAGGIGAGKSVVSRIVEVYGYRVYDCDSRAKTIMDQDRRMIARIGEEIHSSALAMDGGIDRKALARIVFNDADKLKKLNEIVHDTVRADLRAWFDRHKDEHYLFVETAILEESGIDKMVDEVWYIDAPVDVRIGRVMRRNGFTNSEVESRIASQSTGVGKCAVPIHTIINDDSRSVLMQIDRLLK